ncbi:pyruvate, phosphate dikinase [Actinomadura sp. WMMB 499]|uniref:pyruvate, phosphate dikinase n=1 Tax=Actinomadura sp. WMMB 499 TaxID=1219491 RepID=UPI001246192C|nr:pyruvate, phosphate dikinase [Actinomadura sp. WMMB 499]QFG23938.1 pyruvate, phosphate dikinase [Actinomadura sp. WMMB 499]
MTWIHPIAAGSGEPASVLGGKARGLVTLRRLGLPVPPGFAVGTAACRAFLRDGRFPGGLDAELAAAVAGLEDATGRRLGGPDRPLVLAVRSGGAVSMPGMMSTVLNLGLTERATEGLAAETGDARFAHDARRRFLSSFAAAVGVPPDLLDAAAQPAPGPHRHAPPHLTSAAMGLRPEHPAAARDEPGLVGIRAGEALIRERVGKGVPDDARRQLDLAVRAVWTSWNSPRARTYRSINGIADGAGTAVTVQAMVFGNRDERSGTGVAFSRDPGTGEPVPSGEVLFGGQGEDVVSGRTSPARLAELADREPAVWSALVDALHRIEEHHRDACHVEFTFESGELWFLQVRAGGLAGRAAVRVAVDLCDAGVIDRREAVRRVSPHDLRHARAPRLDAAPADVLARGTGASPGVATGRAATTADAAVAMASGGPVVLVRPYTSPLDMHGLAAAAGVVTAAGGTTSHAAVVARSLGRPAVVGAAGLDVRDGALVTIDGTSGEVVAGRAGTVVPPNPHLDRLLAWAAEIT